MGWGGLAGADELEMEIGVPLGIEVGDFTRDV